MLSRMLPVLMRSPPITNGYWSPNCAFTFSIAARIACAFSSLLKSVNGSLRNSVGMITPSSVFVDMRVRSPRVSKGCHRWLPSLTVGLLTHYARTLSRPLAGLLQFLDSALDDLALERRHLIQKNDPVTVIRFVQHAAGSQFRTVQLKLLAVDIMCAHDCPQVALNVEENSRERKTAFVAVLFAFHADHFRIDHYDSLRRILATRAVHHEQTLGRAHLHSGQSHAGRGIHRLKHTVDKLFQLVVKFGDRLPGCVENGIRPSNYFQRSEEH